MIYMSEQNYKNLVQNKNLCGKDILHTAKKNIIEFFPQGISQTLNHNF